MVRTRSGDGVEIGYRWVLRVQDWWISRRRRVRGRHRLERVAERTNRGVLRDQGWFSEPNPHRALR